jgi:hypothetical protein
MRFKARTALAVVAALVGGGVSAPAEAAIPVQLLSITDLHGYLSEIGGLRVLSGSPRLGVLPVKPSDGPGMMRAEADEDHPEWRTASYQPGDVLLFTSLTVHGAMPNRTRQLRVSADFRYQALTAPMARDALGTGKPHYHPDVPDFPTLTRGWESTASIEVPPGVQFVDRFDPRLDEVPTPVSRFAAS